MADFPTLEWMERFRDRVNSDPEMDVVGDWFSTALSLNFGDRRYVLRVRQGEITDIAEAPRLDARCDFGMSVPSSPEGSRRENWWYYSQSGPGVYAGDVHYYSVDWDARDDIKRIDTNRCKVSLLTGEFDYSCTPAMTREVADAIPGARATIMKGMGHFPMIENYPVFRDCLLPELDYMAD